MKLNHNLQQCLRTLLLGTALATSALTANAQNVVLDFGTNSIWYTNTSTATWHWWGGATSVREWVTNDAANDPASGSVKFTITWPSNPGSDDFQYSVGMPLSGVGAYDIGTTLTPINYTNMTIDILWDTNASTADVDEHQAISGGNPGGDPNGFGVNFVATQYGQTWVPNPNQPVVTSNGLWQRFTIPINPSWPVIPGLIFKKWRPNTGAGATNLAGKMSVFYVDNVVFNFNTNLVIPPPELTIERATKGLNVAATGAGQYQRNGVRSLPADSVQWFGNPDPVTYSVTIAEFPSGATYGGYQAHMFLSPDSGGATGPDWNDPNVIFVQWQENADGTGVCNFRFKTNSPNSNGVDASGFFGTGFIMQLIAPTVKGTWNVTFTNNQYITVTGPGGVSTNFSMGADAAAWFQSLTPSMGTFFGTQPNNPANLSQRAVFSNIKIMNGNTTVVDDSFPVAYPPDEVDLNSWIVRVDGGPIALKVVESPGPFWLSWTLPDPYASGVQIASNVTSSTWIDTGLPFRLATSRHEVFVPTNILTGYENAGYFRLFSTNAP
jgi:hypothetical protein